jgi:hypothetical protein
MSRVISMPQPRLRQKLTRVKIVLGLILVVNFLFWCGSRDVYERWSGVPPVPSRNGAVMMTLGDPEFSYRALSLMLQNLGDTGADTTPLKDYNYEQLGKWFSLLDSLDPVSDHVPFIAAYYFGATKVPKNMGYIVDYLGVIGQRHFGEKWRWLAYAVYAAQHRLYDSDLALKLAYILPKMPNSAEMPAWARDMPAFVLKNKGDKEAARELMENMLATSTYLSPDEIANLKFTLINDMGVDPREVEQATRMRGTGH